MYRHRWKDALARSLHVLQRIIWISPIAMQQIDASKRKAIPYQYFAQSQKEQFNKAHRKVQNLTFLTSPGSGVVI